MVRIGLSAWLVALLLAVEFVVVTGLIALTPLTVAWFQAIVKVWLAATVLGIGGMSIVIVSSVR